MKLGKREYLRFVKAVIKGLVTVLIGLYITRQFVGIGRLSSNLISGIIAYAFIAVSGILCIIIIQFGQNSSESRKLKKFHLIIIDIGLILVGVIITLLNILFFYLNILIIIIPISMGIVWIILTLYAPKKLADEDILKIIVSLVFAFGLIYGAGLNTLLIPVYVFIFFSALISSQISRETIKGFIITKKRKVNKYITDHRTLEVAVNLSFKFQVLTFILLIVPVFSGITYPVLYLWILVPTLLCLGVACYLSFKGMNENKLFKKTGGLLKFGILFELLAILLSS